MGKSSELNTFRSRETIMIRLKDIAVNRTLQLLNGRSLKITITVSLDFTLYIFSGYRGEGSLERYNGEEWKEESLNYVHGEHASVILPCS